MWGNGRMMTPRAAAGFAALAALVLLGMLLPRWTRVRCPAVVEAGRVFTVASIEPGRYRCSLRSGRPAVGSELISERVLQFERNDLVHIQMLEGAASGKRVAAGTPVAAIRSLGNTRRLEELEAARQVLGAQRDLLEAGSRIEEIREAEGRIELALAEDEAARSELERVRSLSGLGLVSEAELEVAEQEAEVSLRRVDVARAALEVARGSARPEELAEADARRGALDAGIDEARALLEEELILCPIDGVADAGGAEAEIRVCDTGTVYLKIPVPEPSRSLVGVGDTVRFETASGSASYSGTVVDVAPTAAVLGDRWVFWVSAAVENPGDSLPIGAAGTAEILPESMGKRTLDNLFGALR